MGGKHTKERKVAQILLELGPAVRKRFGDFLHSPYFNISPQVLEFWQALDKQFLKAKGEGLEEDLFESWKPGEAFDSGRLSQAFFRLGEALNRFLAEERFQASPEFLEQMALEEMLDRNLDEFYGRKSRRQAKELESGQNGSWELSLLRLRHLLHHASYLLRNDREQEAMRHLERLLHSLGNFTELTRTMVLSSLLNGAFLAGSGLQANWPEARDLPSGPESALLDYHRRVVRLQMAELKGEMKEALAAYHNLKGWLQLHGKSLGAEEQADACIHALNFCIRRHNAGDGGFPAEEEILAWYAQLMRRYLDRGRVNWSDFLNYGTILAQKGKLGEVERLTLEVEGKLQAGYGESARIYLRGLLAYHRAAYREALRNFWEVMAGPQHPQISAVNRTMLLRTLYELGEYGDLAAQAEAFRQYLIRAGKRKALALRRKEAYKDFARLLVKLCSLQNGQAVSPSKKEALAKEIEGAEVVSKHWLLEQVVKI